MRGVRRRRTYVAAAAAAALAIVFLAPVLPSTVVTGEAASLTTLSVPRVGGASGWGEVTDPSGSYWIYRLNDTTCNATACYTTEAMNLTSYDHLLLDPYSGGLAAGPGCLTATQGSFILISCASARCAPDHNTGRMACMSTAQSLPSVAMGTVSAAYWLVHRGAIYAGGRYIWG